MTKRTSDHQDPLLTNTVPKKVKTNIGDEDYNKYIQQDPVKVVLVDLMNTSQCNDMLKWKMRKRRCWDFSFRRNISFCRKPRLLANAVVCSSSHNCIIVVENYGLRFLDLRSKSVIGSLTMDRCYTLLRNAGTRAVDCFFDSGCLFKNYDGELNDALVLSISDHNELYALDNIRRSSTRYCFLKLSIMNLLRATMGIDSKIECLWHSSIPACYFRTTERGQRFKHMSVSTNTNGQFTNTLYAFRNRDSDILEIDLDTNMYCFSDVFDHIKTAKVLWGELRKVKSIASIGCEFVVSFKTADSCMAGIAAVWLKRNNSSSWEVVTNLLSTSIFCRRVMTFNTYKRQLIILDNSTKCVNIVDMDLRQIIPARCYKDVTSDTVVKSINVDDSTGNLLCFVPSDVHFKKSAWLVFH
jgi:hypothetical protein